MARALLSALAAPCLFAPSAHAVLDIEDRGPLLRAGRYALRVSNVGVLGNPWFDVGRSFDPSFEFPRGSGQELLGRAELWVSARRSDGTRRVSGGPMMEWRPTLDPDDRVRGVMAGAPGTRWNFDNDGDGRINEDPLNERDDDGDGRVDEDFDLPAQQMLVAEYTDDQPEAVAYNYSNGEPHVPLGLSVRQEAFAWAGSGAEDVAGFRFVITNSGGQLLSDLRLGLYVDLDARRAASRGGHLDDRVIRVPYELLVPEGSAYASAGGDNTKPCLTRLSGEAVVVADARSGLPCAAVVPLTHTTDPLAMLRNDALPGVREARSRARAPARDTTFRMHVFAQDMPPGQGGAPVLDEHRIAALEGRWPTIREDGAHDYAVLVSCGPFPYLAPGTSVEFCVALVVASVPDSIPRAATNARLLARGSRHNLQPDVTSRAWYFGETGITGHELCYEPPPGVRFAYDPHCPEKFYTDPLIQHGLGWRGPDRTFEVDYAPGACVWSDFDCDLCTGHDGTDAVRRWAISSLLPSPPGSRMEAGDAEITIEWDDSPESALRAGLVGDTTYSFGGYKLYRLDDWRRVSQLPPSSQWQTIAVYRADTTGTGGLPLAAITDSTLPPEGAIGGVPKHPIGRYRVVDRGLHNGADYNYVITSFVRVHAPADTLPSFFAERESPFLPDLAQRLVPHATSRAGPPRAWVAPNPYRGRAEWERAPVPGDPFTRHLDFMGLPRERCTIRVYTVAGDLVTSIEHDGSTGDGQAAWNLISRNGQDVASGIYLFTVDGPSGRQVGRFVVIR